MPYLPSQSLWSACFTLLSVPLIRLEKFGRHFFSLCPAAQNSLPFSHLTVFMFEAYSTTSEPISLRNILYNQADFSTHSLALHFHSLAVNRKDVPLPHVLAIKRIWRIF